jgi:hypothetical protein
LHYIALVTGPDEDVGERSWRYGVHELDETQARAALEDYLRRSGWVGSRIDRIDEATPNKTGKLAFGEVRLVH